MNDPDNAKIGAGHAEAMLRLGLNELRNAAYLDSNVAQRYPEQGLFGTATPQEVMDSKRVEPPLPDEPRDSIVAERLRQAELEPVRDDKARDMELDR